MDDGAAYASSPSPTRAAREPFRADGVEEHFLDGRASTTTSMVEALSRSLSVVVLANVATVAEHGDRPEVYALRTRAIVVSTAEFAEREKLRASGLLDEMMAGDQHDPDRVRMPIAETCSAEDQAICDRLLVRAVARLRALGCAPEDAALLSAWLGPCLETPSLVAPAAAAWSPGEPALNLYRPGGAFGSHQDEQALTVLVPLTDRNGDFEGGGTAFFGLADDGASLAAEPSFVLAPTMGSAVLWGGQVHHAAVSVAAGLRIVFVGSFSPAAATDDGGAPPAAPMETDDGDGDEAAAAEAKEETDEAAAAALVGQTVRVVGLAGRPELNGRVGVVRRFVAARGRLAVEVEGEATLALRAENVEVAPPPANDGDEEEFPPDVD